MAQYSRTFSTACPAALLDSINDNGTITPFCEQIIDLGNGTSIFDFAASLSGAEETELDSVLAGWSCPSPEMTGDQVTVNDGQTSTDNLWTSQQVTDYIASEIAAVSAGDPTNVNGKLFEVTFAYQSTAKNRWIPQESSETNLSSDVVPYIVPWDCELLAMTFNNQRDWVDTDVEIWTSALGANPYYTKTKVFTWDLDNVRSAVKTDFSGSAPTFSRGDRVGIYMKDRGTDPKGAVIKLMFRMTNNTRADVSDNVEQNFSNDGDDD